MRTSTPSASTASKVTPSIPGAPLKDRLELLGELRITVADQETMSQEALDGIREVPRDLGHEGSAWMRHDSRNIDSTGLEIDEEQDVHRLQPAEGPDLRREEVRGRDLTPVSLQERLPR